MLHLQMIRHNCIRIEAEGIHILTDPFLRDEVPASYILKDGKELNYSYALREKFRNRVGEAIPEYDLITISHEHADHLNAFSLGLLPKKDVPILFPASLPGKISYIQSTLTSLGFTNLVPLQEWETYTIQGIEVICLPMFRPDKAVVPSADATWLFKTPHGSVYIAHDAMENDFLHRTIGIQYHPDIALLPVHSNYSRYLAGAIGKYGYCAKDALPQEHIPHLDIFDLETSYRLNMGPEEAAYAAGLLKCKIAIPIGNMLEVKNRDATPMGMKPQFDANKMLEGAAELFCWILQGTYPEITPNILLPGEWLRYDTARWQPPQKHPINLDEIDL